MIECDGVPYNIIRTIISEVLRCKICNKCFYGLSCFQDHICYVLNQATPKHEFEWLVPICGLLHLEMNLGRAFLKLNWEVFFRRIGIELGFKSVNAMKYLQKGSDHHKMWHLFEIVYPAICLELLVPYVDFCKSTGDKPTCNGYWDWSRDAIDPNYIYMQQVVSYLHALMSLRSGMFEYISNSNCSIK